ncbi:MAG: hypothetical protein KC422_07525 [Trueperaceae bacterium]|nr:hypothetical protein [Trueperaceae bacterium]
MRIGFISQLLWDRYGDFWVKLFGEFDAEIHFASAESSLALMQDERLATIPGWSFKLAAAQALSLLEVDLLLAPDLNWGEYGQKASGQDPWIANFPETLQRQFAALPPVLAVPAWLEPEIESLVTTSLMNISHDPAKVRRAWERHRGRLKPQRFVEPRWIKRASEKEMVGLLAQPWTTAKDFLNLPETSYLIRQSQLDPKVLRAEGMRFDPKLIPTDQEVMGAARLLARRGSVDRLIFLADKDAGADQNLYSRVQKLVHKPLELVYLQDLTSPEQVVISL